MAFDDGVKTVSGSIAHTDDAAAKVPFVSLKCGIAPTLTGKSAIECTQTGKNLLDNTSLFPASGSVSSYYFKQFDYNSNLIPLIKLQAGVTYTFSLDITSTIEPFNFSVGCGNGSYSNDILTVYNKSNGRISITFTPTAVQLNNGDIFAFRCPRYQAQNTFDYSVSNVQLEVGSTATTYEPYTAPTVSTVNLGRTIYGGTADVVNGTGEETYGYIVFDGSTDENWTDYANYEGYSINISTMKSGVRQNGVCNQLTMSTSSQQGQTNVFWLGVNTKRFYVIGVYSSMGNTLEAFRTYLSSNPLILVYPLDETTDFTFTPITPTPETVGKVNNVYCNTGNTELTYYDNAHGFSEVTVNKNGVSQTAYLHKVIFGGLVDVVQGKAEPKNLFNEDWEVGGINDTTGLPNSETNKIRSKTFSSIKGGTTCYVSVPQPIRVLFYASDESFISETANIRNNSFSVPSNCSLFKIRGTVDYGTTYNNDIMICYGSSASEYVPHFEPFTFPPISMETDEGENTLYADEGNSAIVYRKEST